MEKAGEIFIDLQEGRARALRAALPALVASFAPATSEASSLVDEARLVTKRRQVVCCLSEF